MMEKFVEFTMTRLFLLAEYVLETTSSHTNQSAVATSSAAATRQEIVPTIRFTNEDRMVEGDLFE